MCTGQNAVKKPADFKVIGGASGAIAELDAKKAIREGFELGLSI